jgi:uncharacterized protein (DUF433 family)
MLEWLKAHGKGHQTRHQPHFARGHGEPAPALAVSLRCFTKRPFSKTDGSGKQVSDRLSGSFPVPSWRTLKEGGPEQMTSLDWSQCPAVESIPGKVNGAWVFRDTRLPVATVIENLEDLSVEEVMEQFDVTREQITAVLDFVAQSLRVSAPPAQDSAPVDAHSF